MTKTIGSLDLSALNNLYDETQYFWFESSAQPWGAGAHVTLYPQSEFTKSTHANYLKGQNILINTDGFSIRNGTLSMMTLDNNSLDFNVVDTVNGTYTNVASFGATSAQIGQTSGVHTIINTNGLQVFSNATDNFIDLRTSYARFGSMCYFDNNTFQIARLNGTYRSITYNLQYPFSDGLVGDDIQPLQIYQHTNTDNEDLHSRIPRLLVVNLQAGQSVTTTIEPETSTGMLVWTNDLAQYAIRAAYDENGNQITKTGITFSMNQTTLAVTISVASSYTGGKVHSVLLGLFGSGVYGSTIVGNWHDYSNWDTTHMPADSYGYWQNTVGWVPYPFVVGIGKRVYSQGKFNLQRANGLTVDWSGNTVIAGDITVKGHSTPIGNFQTASNTKSISTGTSYITSGISVTLDAGVYILVGQAEFASNNTGRRGLIWRTGDGNVSGTSVNQATVSGTTTRMQSVCLAHPSSSTTYTLYATQNSGSSLSTSFYVRVTRIA